MITPFLGRGTQTRTPIFALLRPNRARRHGLLPGYFAVEIIPDGPRADNTIAGVNTSGSN